MLGCDIIEVDRVRKLKNLSKVFTLNELEYARKFSDPYVHLAGFFALKESVVKAMDIPLKVSQIEVLHNENGSPRVNILVELKDRYNITCPQASRPIIRKLAARDATGLPASACSTGAMAICPLAGSSLSRIAATKA